MRSEGRLIAAGSGRGTAATSVRPLDRALEQPLVKVDPEPDDPSPDEPGRRSLLAKERGAEAAVLCRRIDVERSPLLLGVVKAAAADYGLHLHGVGQRVERLRHSPEGVGVAEGGLRGKSVERCDARHYWQDCGTPACNNNGCGEKSRAKTCDQGRRGGVTGPFALVRHPRVE